MKKKAEIVQQNLRNSIILGLDVSQERTGWALMKYKTLLGYGYINRPDGFDGVKFRDPMFSKFLYKLKIDVANQIRTEISWSPDIVVMEDINIRFQIGLKILSQIQAAVKIGVEEAIGAEVHLINNLTVKALFRVQTKKHLITKETNELAKTFKVKPVKIEMVQRVNKVLGTNFTYDQNDEADATALAFTYIYKNHKRG